MMGGGPIGPTVYIDAKGADPAAFARVWAALQQLGATIEQRSVGAVVDRANRSVVFS